MKNTCLASACCPALVRQMWLWNFNENCPSFWEQQAKTPKWPSLVAALHHQKGNLLHYTEAEFNLKSVWSSITFQINLKLCKLGCIPLFMPNARLQKDETILPWIWAVTPKVDHLHISTSVWGHRQGAGVAAFVLLADWMDGLAA